MPFFSYPSQLYPQSKSQLQQILTDYYSLTLQLQTLQRHILKIQTQNQLKHKLFTDQVQKLKLYIDQCQNQIKKRQQRQLILIERLKELENSRLQQIEELRFSRNQKKGNEEMLVEWENVIREKQEEWNRERQLMISDNQTVVRENIQLNKQIAALNLVIKQKDIQKQKFTTQYQTLLASIRKFDQQVTQLTHQLHLSQQNIHKLQQQNHLLQGQIQQLNALREDTLKQLSQQQQVLPISSSCLNCLKLTKLHQSQVDNKSQQIHSLKKDIESLLAFFQLDE